MFTALTPAQIIACRRSSITRGSLIRCCSAVGLEFCRKRVLASGSMSRDSRGAMTAVPCIANNASDASQLNVVGT
jgi:hypothetical protein